MAKIIMMKGLPASGKSTRAKELCQEYGNFYRVSRDGLREMLHFGKWTGKNEGITIEVQKYMVLGLLNADRNVIVDDTNLGESHEQRWKEIAKFAEAKFEVVELDTPWEECVTRDGHRLYPVGKSVILPMALGYGLVKKETKIVLCDLDGTLCDVDHRLPHVKKDPKDWKAFFGAISGDTLRKDIWEKVRKVHTEIYDGDPVNSLLILVSARPDTYRKETEAWLVENGIYYDALIMRRAGDTRADVEVKQDFYNQYFKPYDVVKVFDDRPSVVRMWESNGLSVENCGAGVEF